MENVAKGMLFSLCRIAHRAGLPPISPEDPEAEAVARHIGLPTRLLDWTRSPLIAAYFAAAHALRPELNGEFLAVFAMSSLFRHNSHILERRQKPEPAGFGNPNFVAQQGQFVLIDSPPVDMLDGVSAVDVASGVPASDRNMVDKHLTQIRLPTSQAPELLRVLRDQGVHGASLFPGLPGVLALSRELLLCPEVPIFGMALPLLPSEIAPHKPV